MYSQSYKGVIWTNHALDRLKERRISQGDAWVVFSNPDQSRKGESSGSWIYYKTFGNKRLEVVAKKNERGEWIILSVWERLLERYDGQKKQNWLIRLIKKLFN